MGQKLSEFLDFLYGFRKLITFLLVFIVSVVFRIKGLISGDNFADVSKATFIAFAAGNSVEHFTSAMKSYLNNKTPGDTQ